MYYILNTVTGHTFDPIENKFFDESWEVESTEDKIYLENLMKDDYDRFYNCKIVQLNR